MQPLSADDIAEAIYWSIERPAHVNIQELVIYPTDQAGIGLVHRTT
jgi:NADP-dependent 3-hydroxy acid dehydrogenase YdfG